MERPLVSIVMPAFNCVTYVGDAIQAILKQTFTDYEFIIINDGSTDGTKEQIATFLDKRIRFLDNPQNLGIVKTLNKGLSVASGKYILRTDADDVALENMIESLFHFLETHPDHIVCGGNMRLIGGDKLFTYPSRNEVLKIHTLNACPFSHSTVMIRKEAMDKYSLQYDETIKDGEDHGLWSALLPYGKFHNLEQVTLLYRESPTQVTAQKTYSKNYIAARKRIFSLHARSYFGLEDRQVDRYLQLVMGLQIMSVQELEEAGLICMQALKKNAETGLFDDALLKRYFFIKWHLLCLKSYGLGKKVFTVYKKYVPRTSTVSGIKSAGLQFIKMLSV